MKWLAEIGEGKSAVKKRASSVPESSMVVVVGRPASKILVLR